MHAHLPARRRSGLRARGGWTVAAALPLATVLGTLAFAHAAACIGLRLPAFAALGPSFVAWQTDWERGKSGSLVAGQRVLASEPLTGLPLRAAALSDTARGDLAAAAPLMAAAERITRRDAPVELWLAEHAVRAADVAAALRHYDVLLRTHENLRAPLFQKLAGALSDDTVRAALMRYAAPGTPWFADFLIAASTDGGARSAATLLLDLRSLPDTVDWRNAYAALIPALAREGRFDLLRSLDARLPRAAGTQRLVEQASEASAYPAFRWMLAADADRFAAIDPDGAGAALQVEAAPFSSGVAASRFLLPPAGAQALAWTVYGHAGGSGNAAHWTLHCRDSGLEVRAALLGEGADTLAVPRPCAAADLRLSVNGGTGSERLVLRVGQLRWLPAGRPPTSHILRKPTRHGV